MAGLTWVQTQGGLSQTDIDTFAELDAIVADETLLAQSSIDTLDKINAIITDATLGDEFTGTQGSVVFLGSDGKFQEDNANFFWDDTANELAVGNNAPAARVHVSRDLSTGDGIRMTHGGEDSAALAFYVGQGSATGDLLVTGDGRVGINEDEATTNAKLRIQNDSGTSGIAAALIVNNDDTGSIACAQFFHDGTTQDAVDITANSITNAIALDVSANALTSGKLASFTSSSSSTTSRELFEIVNDNSTAVNATPLVVRNDAAGEIALFRSGLTADDIEFGILTTGHVVMQPTPTTDVAPQDDTTSKQWSIQRLGGDPTSAAFVKFSNSPGTPTNDFYLVLEEKT